MKVISLIAKNTTKEILRDRILYGLFVFAVLFISMSVGLGQLSYAEQARISLDFGLSGIQISALLVSVFVGCTLVSRELEKRTIFTLLSHAVTRSQFILGKFFGMTQVLLIILSALFAVVFVVISVLSFPFNMSIVWALFGVLLESMILLSVTIFFGVFTTPMMSVIFTISIFLIGHWLSDLMFFAAKSESAGFVLLAKSIYYLVPDLERFNWKNEASYALDVGSQTLLSSAVYGVAWIGVYLCLAMLIFRRRDFV